jgi:hypothetical protein
MTCDRDRRAPAPVLALHRGGRRCAVRPAQISPSAIIKGERAKQSAKEAKARTIADEIDNDIGSIPADVARKEVGTWDR